MKSHSKKTFKSFLVFFSLYVALSHASLVCDPVWGEKIFLQQPDGSQIQGFVYGDEFYTRIETGEGFTVILNEQTGEIEYAVLKEKRLGPSGLIVGRAPETLLERMNIPRHLSDRSYRIAEMRIKNPDLFHDLDFFPAGRTPGAQALTGTKKVFAVCVQFQPEDNPPTQWSAGLYSPQGFQTRLFSDDPSSLSMTNFFKAQSYNQFWPEGEIFGEWVTLPQTATWYRENGSWKTIIEDALDAIKAADPAYDFSQHANNGEMDLIVIWAGTRQTWGTFYWPHMSTVGFTKYSIYINDYSAVNERNGDGTENEEISTFCHEYGHMTGLPDLYDYSDFQNRPLGYYCLMGESDARMGFCAFMKAIKYGWVEAVEIAASGSYIIDALGLQSVSNPRVYRIYIDYPLEYLLLENRLDGSHPDYENYPDRRSGLLISHVDENYPPASCLPGYTFYGVEAVCPALSPLITSLISYMSYWNKMVWAADYGYSQIGPFYPDDKPPGSYLTLVYEDDAENVIYRNTRGHVVNTDINITDVSGTGNSMSFNVTKTSFTLTLSAGPGGTTEPPPGVYAYDKDREVTVTAVEDTYYSFLEWTGDVPLSSKEERTLTLTMDSDKTVTAQFKKICKPLDFQGEKVLNRSLSQEEYINVLTWKSNPLNEGIQLDKYRIYYYSDSDGSWYYFDEVSASQFEYQQRRVDKDQSFSFALVAVDTNGREGEPAYVVVL